MKLNNNIRCLIETLVNRVMDFNERDRSVKAILKVTNTGLTLHLDFMYWSFDFSMTGIYATTEKHLEDMVQWLDEKIAIIEKDEIDPKAEAQRELDKEQI
jgi:hypothetical protein